MPMQREWRALDVARADRDLIDRAAAFLRDGQRREYAGLQRDEVAGALADLLEALAQGVGELDDAVRWQTRESCRALLGVPMASPPIGRTRRRQPTYAGRILEAAVCSVGMPFGSALSARC